MLKKYSFYLFRWQLSTPILAGVLYILSDLGALYATIIANLIGGLIFFWVDKYIFKVDFLNPLWEIKDNVICEDCGKECKGYRLIKTKNYDKIVDKNPQFRCETCSDKKSNKLRKKGIKFE